MKKQWLYRLIFIAAFILFAVYNFVLSNPRCESYARFKETAINALVINKYLDPGQHSYPTIEYTNFKEHDTIKLVLVFEDQLYDLIGVSDTIVKPSGDSVLLIRNDKKHFERIVDFGCDKK